MKLLSKSYLGPKSSEEEVFLMMYTLFYNRGIFNSNIYIFYNPSLVKTYETYKKRVYFFVDIFEVVFIIGNF